MFELAAKSLQLTKVPLGLKNLTLPAGLGDPTFIVIPPEVVDKFRFLKTLCPGKTFVNVDDVKSSEISTTATVVLVLEFVNEILIPHNFE